MDCAVCAIRRGSRRGLVTQRRTRCADCRERHGGPIRPEPGGDHGTFRGRDPVGQGQRPSHPKAAVRFRNVPFVRGVAPPDPSTGPMRSRTGCAVPARSRPEQPILPLTKHPTDGSVADLATLVRYHLRFRTPTDHHRCPDRWRSGHEHRNPHVLKCLWKHASTCPVRADRSFRSFANHCFSVRSSRTTAQQTDTDGSFHHRFGTLGRS